MPSVKQGDIKYHFLSLWYDTTWDWTPVSRTTGEHSTHYAKEDLGSIQGRIIPKTLKMVLDTSLLNTQQYKVRIKGKVKKSRERSSALP